MNGINLSIASESLDELVRMIGDRLATAMESHGSHDRGWPAFMSIETAAAYLDVSVERIRKLKERHEIAFIQEAPRCRVLFARADLDAWMDSMRRQPWGGGT